MLRKIPALVLIIFLTGCHQGDNRQTDSSSGHYALLNYDFPWYDPERSFEERVQLLINEMTLEEKISQLTNDAAAVERLGIPEYNWWSEALHGVARNGRATVFPQPIGLAATFDQDLIYRVFSAVSDEARAKYEAAQRLGNRGQYAGLTFWTPNVNIFRDPRWGRGMETYGEDPYLTAQMGKQCVLGLQGNHPKYLKTGACAKHYAVHSGPEALRHEFDAVTTMKDLHETYLPAFKALVTEANVESVMGAYNRVNGEPACASQLLLKDILLDDWGFQGHILSDCGAIRDFHTGHMVTGDAAESAAMALNYGVSLNCGNTFPALKEALERGLVSEATIDERLATLFITRFELGLFDPPEMNPFRDLDEDVINSEPHDQLAYEAAAKSIVLLKNNGVLPLKTDMKKLYVTGPQANNGTVLLGNYYGISPNLVNILEGIASRVDAGTTVDYRMGVMDYFETLNSVDWVTGGAREAEATIAVMGISQLIEGEEGESLASTTKGDRLDLNLPAHQMDYLRKLKKDNDRPVIVVLTGGSPITMPELHDLADAILWVWYPGQEGGNAVADVIFGNTVPSGKLPITFPASVDQLPPYEDYSMNERTYRYMTAEPLYPFGYGGSYSRFRLGALETDVQAISPGESLVATVELENVGEYDADEVLQLYVSVPDPDGNQPRWSLKGFQRLEMQKGKSATVTFEVGPEAMQQVNELGEAEILPGTYTLYVGNGSPGSRSEALGVEMVSATFQVR